MGIYILFEEYHSRVGPYHADHLQAVGNVGVAEDVIVQENKKKANDTRCLRKLCGSSPPVGYNYIRGNERTKKNSVAQCLSELSDIKQKESESIEAYNDRFKEHFYKCTKYVVVRTTLKFNITFILGLKKEWNNI